MIDKPVIRLSQGVARDESKQFRAPVDFTLNLGEHIAIMGLNGSGKTLLIETVSGSVFLGKGEIEYDFRSSNNRSSEQIKYMTFRDAYGSADGDYYYQQRWHATENDSAPTVGVLLDEQADNCSRKEHLVEVLGLAPMLDKPIILLSSGELRKFQIAKMLMSTPKVLIVESPFIGLDVDARKLLVELFSALAGESDLQIILSVSSPKDIPGFITHVCVVSDMVCGRKMSRREFVESETFTAERARMAASFATTPVAIPEPLNEPIDCQEVVNLKNINIRYGERKVLDSVDWVIRNGEKWALAGPNGAGKSTLLSLISADNPQSYAQNITLFGRKRGSGESIWDIKRHIGYVSPEMHRSYVADMPAIDIVASGFFDSIGLFRKPDDSQREICARWMEAFGVLSLRDRSFIRLSSGEQRLLILTRAFVKDPDLLILDEPLHGLDCFNKERARAVIEAFCSRKGKTLIYVTHYLEELPACITQTKVLPSNR